jgi:Ca2+-binding RTX toxin-like protein
MIDGGDGNDTVSFASLTSKLSTGVTLNLGGVKDSGGYVSASGKGGVDKVKGVENILGSAYADIFTGDSAANALNGGAGTDFITGGLGTDSLYGGADKVKDVFDFNAISESKTGTARDKVYDFITKIDKIDLGGIDANTASNKTGDQAFIFNNTTAKANSVWYAAKDVDGSTSTKDIIVYGDVNGDGKADFEIGLVGVTSVAVTDFVL